MFEIYNNNFDFFNFLISLLLLYFSGIISLTLNNPIFLGLIFNLWNIYTVSLAASDGYYNIALGNIIGSKINTLLILGIAAIIKPFPFITNYTNIIFLFIISLLLLFLVASEDYKIIKGSILFLIFIIKIFFSPNLIYSNILNIISYKNIILTFSLIFTSLLGTHLFNKSSVSILRLLKISEDNIGIFVISCINSLPLLVTSIIFSIYNNSISELIIWHNIINILFSGSLLLLKNKNKNIMESFINIVFLMISLILLIFMFISRINRISGVILVLLHLLYSLILLNFIK